MPEITTNVDLAPLTTLNIGGHAEYFTEVATQAELQAVLSYAQDEKIPVTVLGGGSNALVSDAGVQGLVIKNNITGITYLDKEESTVSVGAGVWFDDLVADVTERGYWGLENLSGIPGTVGGGVVQNINAYGVTLGDMVQSVTAVHIMTGEVRVFTQSDCDFVYRDSFFKNPATTEAYAVTEVTIGLSQQPVVETTYRSATQSITALLEEQGNGEPTATDIRKAVLAIRKRIGMLAGIYQSAGSFFKNPIVSKQTFRVIEQVVTTQFKEKHQNLSPWHWSVDEDSEKISAAFLMECTPFNKTTYQEKTNEGSVSISPVHTLSIINLGGASAESLQAFVKEINEAVAKEFGIELEPEVTFLS